MSLQVTVYDQLETLGHVVRGHHESHTRLSIVTAELSLLLVGNTRASCGCTGCRHSATEMTHNQPNPTTTTGERIGR